jgi:hypothetical protein
LQKGRSSHSLEGELLATLLFLFLDVGLHLAHFNFSLLPWEDVFVGAFLTVFFNVVLRVCWKEF